MNNTQDFFTRLSDLESGAADLMKSQQQPERQPADIVMCDFLATWWVRRMLTRGKTTRPGAPMSRRAHV